MPKTENLKENFRGVVKLVTKKGAPNPFVQALTPTLDDLAFENHINDLAQKIHEMNHRWWHDSQGRRLDRNVPEMICLIHSELSEAMEAYRKDLQDDKLPHRSGLEVEMADAVIRIYDLCAGLGLDLGGAIRQKLAFNVVRKDHTYEYRMAEGGKKF